MTSDSGRRTDAGRHHFFFVLLVLSRWAPLPFVAGADICRSAAPIPSVARSVRVTKTSARLRRAFLKENSGKVGFNGAFSAARTAELNGGFDGEAGSVCPGLSH